MVRQNFRIALRQLARRPTVSAVMVLTLGLGIGVNASLFSVADAVLFRPLPYPEADELVALWEGRSGREADIPIADGNFFDIYRESQEFLQVAAHMCSDNLISVGATRFRVPTCGHTRDFFEILAVAPLMGSTEAGDPRTGKIGAVIGYRFWQRAFGGADDVLGKSMVILGYPMTITAVMPQSFDFPKNSDIWVNYEPFLGTSRTAHNLEAFGRLAGGTTLEDARGRLAGLAKGLMAAHGNEITGGGTEELTLKIRPLHTDLVGDASRSFTLLFAVVTLVLLIACGNIVSLLTARLLSRGREFGIRKALGASRRHVLAQLLTEGMLYGVSGTLVGLLLARFSLSFLEKSVPPDLLHAGGLALDHRVTLFTLTAGLLAGVACGLLPLFQVSRQEAMAGLRSGLQQGSSGAWARRVGKNFAIAQYAFSWITLAIAALLVFNLIRLVRIEPGFLTADWTATELILPTDEASAYGQPEKLRTYLLQTLEEVASLPRVEKVALTLSLPFTGQHINGLVVRPGGAESGEGRKANPDFRVIDPGYFEALGIPVLRGRGFEATDMGSPEALVLVNQSLVRKLWGDEDPLGETLIAPGLDPELGRAPLRVVGVVADTRYRHLASPPRPALYVLWDKTPSRQNALHLIAATSGNHAGLTQSIHQRILAQDPNLPIGPSETVEHLLRDSTSEPRFRAGFLAAFAILALGLALLGVYGMMSFTFSKRQEEMAVRMAMGASRFEIRLLYLKDGLVFVLFGQLLGGLVYLSGSRFLKTFLFDIESAHLGLTLAVSLALAAVVLVACYLPTRKVNRIPLSQLMRVN